MSPEFATPETTPLEPEKPLYPYQRDMLRAIQDTRHSGVEGAYIDVAAGCGKDFTIAREVKETPRLDKWASEEAKLKAMLGVDRLPRQRIDNNEWQRYGERIATGDKDAKHELVPRCLRHAYGAAKRFTEKIDSNELTVEDYFHHAVEGIYEGIERYDPVKHSSLRQQVYFGVFNKLIRSADNRGLIRLPAHICEQLGRMQKTREELAKKLGSAVLDVEDFEEAVSEASGIDQGKLAKLSRIEETLEYETFLPIEDAAGMVGDTTDALDREVSHNLTRNLLRDTLEENLSYRDRRILESCYGLGGEHPRTLDEIGRQFNMTRECIRQIKNRSLKKLQTLPDAQALRESWDIEKPPTNTQKRRHTNAENQKFVRQRLAAKSGFRQQTDPSKLPSKLDHIAEEDGYHVAVLSDLVSTSLRADPGQSSRVVDKHLLAKYLERDLGLTAPKYAHINHVDYISALNALERHGIVRCHRNHRGTVIESVSLIRY